MNQLNQSIKKSMLLAVVFVQLLWVGGGAIFGTVLAVETAPSGSEGAASTVECPSYTGTTAPTGSSGYTFVYNPETCLWENAYYTWDPVTKSYAPKYDNEPKLNSETGCTETTTWVFNAAKGIYEKRVRKNCPVLAAESESDPSAGSGPESLSSSSSPTGSNGSNYTGSSTISNTGPDSDNQINTSNNNDVDINNANRVSVLTTLNSNATSGDASILNNTTGGNATTGDAQTVANILNMLQSSWDPMYGDISTFTASLLSDYYGDLVFNPDAVLNNTGPNSSNNINQDSDNNLTINNSNDVSIENDVNLNSTSGNATVSGNTTGGDATSGDASSVANIVNMINSMITAGESFFGTIDLYGDLDGDILLPGSLLAQIMNTGPRSDNTINQNNDTDVNVNNANNYNITNNADLTATSGDAEVSGNTNGGSATSGDAETNINQYNFINQNVSAKNGLMVFVNVLGSWVGFLFNAPSGTSSILGTGPDSTNSINSDNNTNVDITNTNDYSITNNLNLNSRSGDATVSGNTTGGNATSGNASSSANLLNMINSNLNFNDWFGVLFINVFGNWNGSFGVDTDAGGKPVAGGQGGGGTASNSPPSNSPQASSSKPTSSQSVASAVNLAANMFSNASGNGSTQASSNEEVTSDTSSTADEEQSSPEANNPAELVANTDGGVNWFAIAAILMALGLLFGERILALVRPKA